MNTRRAEDVEGSQATSERITVTLIPTAWQGLLLLNERTSLSTTDLTNRAIILYEFFDHQLRTGHDFLARDHATGKIELVRLLDAPAGQAAGSTGSARTGRGRAGLPMPGWRHGRHRRPHRAPRGPRLPALANWLTYLDCLAGQDIKR